MSITTLRIGIVSPGPIHGDVVLYLDHSPAKHSKFISTPASEVVWPISYDRFGLSADDEARLRTLASAIHGRQKKIFDQIVATGRDLTKAKKTLGHGSFGEWLKVEFAMSDRTAEHYMLLAEMVDDLPSDKIETVSNLPLGVAYLLASRTVPQSVRMTFLDRVDAGEALNMHEIKKRIPAARRSLAGSPVTKNHRKPVTDKRFGSGSTKPKLLVTPDVRAAVLANMELLERIYSEIADPKDLRTFLEQSNSPDRRIAVLVSMAHFAKRLRERELTSASDSPTTQVS